MQFVIKLKGDSLNLYSPQCKFMIKLNGDSLYLYSPQCKFVIRLKGDSLNLYSPQCKFVLSIWLCFVINLHFELCNDEELSIFNFKPVGGDLVSMKKKIHLAVLV